MSEDLAKATQPAAVPTEGEPVQVSVVPNAKKVVTEGQFRTAEAAGINTEGWEVATPDEGIEPTPEEAPPEPAVDDTDPITPEPVVEPEPEEPEEPKLPTPDQDGIFDFAGQRFREEDGVTKQLVKVDGEDHWINVDKVVSGFSFNQHNDRVAKKLAEDRKALEAEREQYARVEKDLELFSSLGEKEQDIDDLFEPDSDADPNTVKMIKAMQAKIDKLESASIQEQQAKELNKEQAIIAGRIDSSFKEVDALCELKNIPNLDDAAKSRVCREAGENDGTNPAEIALSPVKLFHLIESRFSVKKDPSTVDASEVEAPPASESTSKPAPQPSRIKVLQAKIDKLSAEAHAGQNDQGEITGQLIQLNRELEDLKSKG